MAKRFPGGNLIRTDLGWIQDDSGDNVYKAVEGKVFDKGGAVFNVKHPDFGAKGDGVTDDTAAWKAVRDAIPVGSTILVPEGTYNITSNIEFTKKVRIVGVGAFGIAGASNVPSGSVIRGSGFTLLTFRESFVLENIVIKDNVGSASTIGVLVDNGATGVINWTLRRVSILATFSNLGVGLKTVFGLKGIVDDCSIEGWNQGIQFRPSGALKSNANEIRGCKIRVNTVGLEYDNVDSGLLLGNTIEGNETGVSTITGGGIITCVANHFENTLGSTPTNITMAASRYCGYGNLFAGAGTNRDIVISAGSLTHVSMADHLANGITHNGTGVFRLRDPVTFGGATGSGSVERLIDGSVGQDPPSLADGAGTTLTVAVTGAALGDFAEASFSLDLQGLTMTAWVSAADVVSVRFQNETGGTINLGSGTLRARVRKI